MCNKSDSITSILSSREDADGINLVKMRIPPSIEGKRNRACEELSFIKFRLQYLIVFAAIMLADGLQGTHLYVLYDGYGYSVPTLYAIGFLSGAFTSIFMGAIVDRIGRKKAVIIYCILEIIINYMEQFPILVCLVASRAIGGITTNLLFTVFETWLVTEHRKRRLADAKLETILRDSSIVSNLAAIISGCIAHCLASLMGPVGPFIGAVAFTFVALLIVALLWCENYGNEEASIKRRPSMRDHLVCASKAILNDRNISCIGLIHSLTEGSLQTFVFLWSPMLQSLSTTSLPSVPGLDVNGDPAYGLIFGAFMLFGVVGGFIEPILMKTITEIRRSILPDKNIPVLDKKEKTDIQSVYILTAGCYLCCSILFLVPCMIDKQSPNAFITVLASFLLYEFFVGAFSSSQSILRSKHIPNESKCSIMTMLRLMTNIAVAFGVTLVNHISIAYCFGPWCSEAMKGVATDDTFRGTGSKF